MAPVGKRDEHLGIAEPVRQAVPLELEVPDDLRPEHAQHLGGAGHPEALDDLVRDARATDAVAPLEDRHREAVPRQVARRHQSVVAGADHDRVVPGPHHDALGSVGLPNSTQSRSTAGRRWRSGRPCVAAMRVRDGYFIRNAGLAMLYLAMIFSIVPSFFMAAICSFIALTSPGLSRRELKTV